MDTIRLRIEQLMRAQGLSAKEMAERLGINASTLSNILGERNKPSLEVIHSLLKQFPQVNPDWLLYNQGEMLRTETSCPTVIKKSVQKIVIFYTDGTFEER